MSKYVVDIIQSTVASVQSALGYNVHFQYGNPLEIIENIKQMADNYLDADIKYPLVGLFQDFTEKKGTEIGTESEVSLNLVIVTITDFNYKAPDRYNNSFKPLLYPIYEQLMLQLSVNKDIISPYNEMFEHDKIDRLYWGRVPLFGEKYKNSDYIDAIEIENLKLKIKKC
jgi:hypothetical protein